PIHLPTLFFFTATPPTPLYTLSLHDALPISSSRTARTWARPTAPCRSSASPGGRRARPSCSIAGRRAQIPAPSSSPRSPRGRTRSEEHTSELQSRFDLVCRLLLEKKK